MKTRIPWSGWVVVLLISCFIPVSQAQQLPEELYADLVFYNGYILTVDTDRGDFTIAEAMAVRDGKILMVGANEKILASAGQKTKRVDLENTRAVIPGVINTHTHPNRYAVTNYFKEIPKVYQEAVSAQGRLTFEGKNKDQVLAEVKAIVEKSADSKWIGINGRWDGNTKLIRQISRYDLDKVAPDKPLVIALNGDWYVVVNSKALDMLLDAHPDIHTVLKDQQGNATGHLQGIAPEVLTTEVLPQTPIPAGVLATVYKKELKEHWAPFGVTTIATRLNGNELRGYSLLDSRGEMPIRIAYANEVARRNPLFERDIRRLGILPGHGTAKLWLAGITTTTPDSAPYGGGSICSDYPKRVILADDFFSGEDAGCWWDVPGDKSRQELLLLNRLGYRTIGIHTYGDKGLEIMIDALEKANQEDPVMDKRFAFDHSMMFNASLIEKAVRLNTMWSMASHKLYGNARNADLVGRVYGKEVLDNYYVPVKRLLDAGARVTYESSPGPTQNPMFALQVYVTRKVGSGQVVGARQAVDRKTVLRMMTRWGAEYVFREEELGSIEPGKWADLVVLERNPLDPNVPDERLGEIKILMTLVGGDVVYDRERDQAPSPTPSRGMD